MLVYSEWTSFLWFLSMSPDYQSSVNSHTHTNSDENYRDTVDVFVVNKIKISTLILINLNLAEWFQLISTSVANRRKNIQHSTQYRNDGQLSWIYSLYCTYQAWIYT